ncbi:MAG: response regulator transcription factor [Hyphomonadaceae bacterium]|nr:response regulator transcription factor [Hyphomonadaceae bacterium]
MSEVAAQARLLVIDDDQGLRETLADFFQIEGYAVSQAANVREARAHLSAGEPDLMLLDINMPGGDGLTFAAEMRGRSAIPIIILSGKGAMVDRVVGLEVGADDYLSKPFELRELLARVRAVLRRARVVSPAHFAAVAQAEHRTGRFSTFAFMPDQRALLSPAGEVIELTGAEYNLLAAFIERPNRILSRDAIADLTRKDDWDAFDRSIDTLVSRLRRKLAPYVDASQLIQTVRGEGYVLATDVKWSSGSN